MQRPRVSGKFLYVGNEKLWIRGVTYGAFRPDVHGNEYHNLDVIERDFAQMAASGLNTVRIPHTMPPVRCSTRRSDTVSALWLACLRNSMSATSSTRKAPQTSRQLVRTKVQACCWPPGAPLLCARQRDPSRPGALARPSPRGAVHRAIVSSHQSRGSGGSRHLRELSHDRVSTAALPGSCLLSTSIWRRRSVYAAYLARLQNIAGDRPLLMSEIGLDSLRHGAETQARVLDWQIRTAFAAGCAGALCLPGQTSGTGVVLTVNDWAFGLTDQKRRPKPALAAVRKAFAQVPFPPGLRWPRISVVVCTYNGSRTIRDCLKGLLRLEYPNFEVIVVNDGSTDETADIVEAVWFPPDQHEESWSELRSQYGPASGHR